MTQNIENNQPIENQLIVNDNKGPIFFAKPTRWSNRFKKLKEEVEKDKRCEQFHEDLEEYNTLLDGKSMPTKLTDGGFTEREILAAAVQKEKYWKKFERNKFYETAQLIDVEIFALIKVSFETFITPLIKEGVDSSVVKQKLYFHVITPILKILNEEGYEDEVLNYTADDILGMVYFLTGKCHINWANYDNI